MSLSAGALPRGDGVVHLRGGNTLENAESATVKVQSATVKVQSATVKVQSATLKCNSEVQL